MNINNTISVAFVIDSNVHSCRMDYTYVMQGWKTASKT